MQCGSTEPPLACGGAFGSLDVVFEGKPGSRGGGAGELELTMAWKEN